MIKILIAGDFCPIGKTEELSLDGLNEKIINDFLPKLKYNDLNIVNLECPLIDYTIPIKKRGPALKADPRTIETLKYSNFNLVTLANNHIMDQGEEGLKSTIETCKKNNISHVGAGFNLDEARSPFMKKIKGQKIAILNFAENEFSNTHGNYPGANPMSLVSNFHDIRRAKSTTNYCIVIVHGGNEMYELPSPRFKETLRFYAEAGADAVIAHHSHCCSGYEIHNSTPIFYGIGNFIFDYNMRGNPLWSTGFAVNLILDDSKISFELYPFSQYRESKIGVHLLEARERLDFESRIARLNEIIQDDEKLKNEFLSFVKTKRRTYSHYLQPYSNKILHKLYRLNLLPSLLTKRKRRLYLNLIRCESHRDVMLEVLKT